MYRSFSRGIGLFSLLGLVAVASPAKAQDVEAAATLFNRGLEDMELGRYVTGCPAIAESQRLDPHAGTLFTLAQCEVRWGHVATAVARLSDYLELYEHLTPEQKVRQDERRKAAQEQHDKLVADVPELTLVLPPGSPAGTLVKRDGAVVATASLGIGLPVDPGEHVVSTQAPGGVLLEQRFTIARGEKKPVVLEVKGTLPVEVRPPIVIANPIMTAAPEPAKQASPEIKADPGNRRVAVYAIGGVGIAGLVLSGVMGGVVLGKKPIIVAHCARATVPPGPRDCDQAGYDAATSASTLGLVSTIGFVAGLAGVGTAVILLVAAPNAPKSATGARGPWMSANVLSVGPTGAAVGVHGRF